MSASNLLVVSLLILSSKQMNPYIEDILNRIQDLLALSPPVSISPGITETSDASFVSHSGRGGVLRVHWICSPGSQVISTVLMEGRWQ